MVFQNGYVKKKLLDGIKISHTHHKDLEKNDMQILV